MNKQNILANELDKGESNYDEHCKNILSQPQIIAFFIKHCFKDFLSVDYKTIVEACKRNPPVSGKEDTRFSGSKVIFDVLANVSFPIMKEK
ncbi:MAG: hypothetical protein LUF02_10040 [Erysipelotrichaceae bacterium]|nr:hypothetical protein [Erysipelotrichaceae bacterium]